jgi:ubiquitin carboxyl-terminal hydrolase 20/33
MKQQEMRDDNGLYCDRCKHAENVFRRIEVVKFAPVVIVQLKRFRQTLYGLVKNTIPVDYPLQLDTHRWAREGTGVYELTGAICHGGSLEGGHYTCLVRSLDNLGQWYGISDSWVSRYSHIGSNGRRCDESAMTLIYQSPSQ